MTEREEGATERSWFYATHGDYHCNLDLNWSYAPTYLQKRELIREFMATVTRSGVILDVGCGEGVIVEEFAGKGYNISGIDSNYFLSPIVRKGNVLDLDITDASVEVLLFLDVFEHIHFHQQPKIAEIYRVLIPGGQLLASIPNLAHFNSRVRMAFRGCLDRTDIETNHVGERPFGELSFVALGKVPSRIRHRNNIHSAIHL